MTKMDGVDKKNKNEYIRKDRDGTNGRFTPTIVMKKRVQTPNYAVAYKPDNIKGKVLCLMHTAC